MGLFINVPDPVHFFLIRIRGSGFKNSDLLDPAEPKRPDPNPQHRYLPGNVSKVEMHIEVGLYGKGKLCVVVKYIEKSSRRIGRGKGAL